MGRDRWRRLGLFLAACLIGCVSEKEPNDTAALGEANNRSYENVGTTQDYGGKVTAVDAEDNWSFRTQAPGFIDMGIQADNTVDWALYRCEDAVTSGKTTCTTWHLKASGTVTAGTATVIPEFKSISYTPDGCFLFAWPHCNVTEFHDMLRVKMTSHSGATAGYGIRLYLHG